MMSDSGKAQCEAIRRRMNDVSDLVLAKKDQETAARVLELLAEYPCSVPILVQASRVMQIMDDPEAAQSIGDEDELLSMAQEIDPENCECLEELAYRQFAFYADSNKALPIFQELTRVGREAMQKGLLGQVKCLADVENYAEARELLRKAKEILAFAEESHPEIADLERELRDSSDI